MNFRNFVSFVLSILLLIPVSIFSYSDQDILVELSLEELMEIEIDSGTLTGIKQNRYPGTITVITSDQILNTPSRNIYDLIETYVPGATFVSHYQGLRLGIRGSLSDQNYSYQLLLDGYDINMNSYYGALFELHDKELGFIDRIEIISGSGSATYGPGGTAGIINIITKKPEHSSRTIAYKNIIRYQSEGKSFSIQDNSKKLSIMFMAVLISPQDWITQSTIMLIEPTIFQKTNPGDGGLWGQTGVISSKVLPHRISFLITRTNRK